MELQLNAIFGFDEQAQQLSADFMLVTNWTDRRCNLWGRRVSVGGSQVAFWRHRH